MAILIKYSTSEAEHGRVHVAVIGHSKKGRKRCCESVFELS